MYRKILIVLVLIFLGNIIPNKVFAQIVSTNAFMKNQFIEAGFNQYGCYASTENAPSNYVTGTNSTSRLVGFVSCPSGNWSDLSGVYGDFILPGVIYEGFSVQVTRNGAKTVYTNNRAASNAITPRSPNFTFNSVGSYTDLTWHGEVAGVFQIDCRFVMDGPRILHYTTIKNISGVPLTDVYFARGMDPDQESGSIGIPATYNVIEMQADGTPGSVSWVAGYGSTTPAMIAYYCDNPNSRVGVSGTSSSQWYQILNNPPRAFQPTSGTVWTAPGEYSRTDRQDAAIEMAIFIGDIPAGQSKEVDHEIRLDQPPVVEFEAPIAYTKDEGETFTYTLTRKFQLETPVNVKLRLSAASGTTTLTSSDFDGVVISGISGSTTVSTLPQDFVLTFGQDEVTKTISVTAAYDAVTPENLETFQIEIIEVISDMGGVIARPNNIVTGTIRDVPLPIATIGGCTTVNEGSNCTLTVTLSKVPIAEVGPSIMDINFAGTATFGAANDYTITPLTNITHTSGSTYRVTIPVGQTTATFRLNALTDNVYEPGNETVIPTISPVSGVISTNPTTTVTIVDQTAQPVLNINPAGTVQANEGDLLTYTITRTGSTCSKDITVLCGTSNNTAVAPGDYTAKSITITLAPGEDSKTFEVQTMSDKLIEGDEYLYVTLSSPVNATLQGGVSTLRTDGKIVDRTDGAIVVLKQTPAGNAAERPLTHGSFRIKFADDEVKTSPTRKVKVSYTFDGSTSEINRDHTASPVPVGEATIPVNSNYVDVSINVIDNYLVQGNHDVQITILEVTPE